MKPLIIFLLVLVTCFLKAQSICDISNFESIKDVDLSKIDLIRKDTVFYNIIFNCVFICENGRAKVFGNISGKGKKHGRFYIVDSKNENICSGEFKNNKKTGYWKFQKRRSTSYYRRGKLIRTRSMVGF